MQNLHSGRFRWSYDRCALQTSNHNSNTTSSQTSLAASEFPSKAFASKRSMMSREKASAMRLFGPSSTSCAQFASPFRSQRLNGNSQCITDLESNLMA